MALYRIRRLRKGPTTRCQQRDYRKPFHNGPFMLVWSEHFFVAWASTGPGALALFYRSEVPDRDGALPPLHPRVRELEIPEPPKGKLRKYFANHHPVHLPQIMKHSMEFWLGGDPE